MKDKRRFVISNDGTVPPYAHRFNVVETPKDIIDRDEYARMMFEAKAGSCLFAYALSQQGARKILYHVGIQGEATPVDVKISHMCTDPKYNFKCFGVFPQLVDAIRMGATNEDSDIAGIEADLIGERKGWEVVQIYL